jgi:hypothetical protein
MRVKLDRYDKLRLAELVDSCLTITNDYTISSSGEVDYSEQGLVMRVIKGVEASKMDFLTVVHNVSESIMGRVNLNDYSKFLCGKALGILIDTNNRPEVIKCLYAAFLLKDNLLATPNGRGNASQGPLKIDKIEKVTRTEIVPAKFEKIPTSNDLARNLSKDVANILNNELERGSIIVINE